MNMPWTCISIGLPLIALVLVVAFLRIRALLCKVTELVVVEAWYIVLWHPELPCSALPLGRAIEKA